MSEASTSGCEVAVPALPAGNFQQVCFLGFLERSGVLAICYNVGGVRV
ncbi:hypothetical protein [Kamptonema formosum]|nr:hypothetical protein [Oscillatoria sp. PCC 10802]